MERGEISFVRKEEIWKLRLFVNAFCMQSCKQPSKDHLVHNQHQPTPNYRYSRHTIWESQQKTSETSTTVRESLRAIVLVQRTSCSISMNSTVSLAVRRTMLSIQPKLLPQLQTMLLQHRYPRHLQARAFPRQHEWSISAQHLGRGLKSSLVALHAFPARTSSQ